MSSSPLIRSWLYSHVPPHRNRYGAYLSQDQVAELVRPHPDTVELIGAWLVHHGIRSSSISTTHGGGWLTVSGVLVSQANEMLGASYRIYRNAKTNDTIVRTVGYGLPTVLHGHIKTVAPTTYFPSTRVRGQTPRRRSLGGPPAQGASGNLATPLSSRGYHGPIDPGMLRWLYRTFPYQPTANGRNRLAVVGFDGELPSQEDLTVFMTHFSKKSQAATFTIEQVNGGVNFPDYTPGLGNTEVQYASAMAYPTPLVFYSAGGTLVWNQEEGEARAPIAGDKYLEWFHHVFREGNIPQTISLSDGEIELALPPEYAANLCFLFAVLGAQGVSVLAASGSDGVGEGDCWTNMGFRRFKAEFPASCTCGVLSPLPSTTSSTHHSPDHRDFAGPYVTAVGGTAGLSEWAAPNSGGGFSEYFERPPYQENLVPRYIDALDEDEYDGLFKCVRCRYPTLYSLCNMCSILNRGYPDIASESFMCQSVVNYAIIFIGFESSTSCAVSVCLSLFLVTSALRRPFSSTRLIVNVQTVAGIISLINDFLISRNRPPLGFLNPWLYGAGSAGLKDITSGFNPGCGTKGFHAANGWDAVRSILYYRRWLIFVS